MQRKRSSSDSDTDYSEPRRPVKKKIDAKDRMAVMAHGKVGDLSKKWFTHFFLLAAIIVYTFLGALLYTVVEGGPEAIQMDQIVTKRNEIIDKIQALVTAGSPGIEQKTNTLLQEYEGILVQNFNDNGKLMMKGSDEPNWSFFGSAFFCGTVYTTIGYGHIAPLTASGRILTIVYSLIGVPLFLTLLADYGKILTKAIKFIWLYVRRCYYTGTCRKPIGRVVTKGRTMDDEEDIELGDDDDANETDDFNLPVTLALSVFVIYMFIGAVIFFMWEEWTFFQSFYFIFVSLSTIGFGDFVPTNEANMMVLLLYLVFGLALTSMCINVVREKITDTFSQASAKLGQSVGIELEEEDDDDEDDESKDPKEPKEPKERKESKVPKRPSKNIK